MPHVKYQYVKKPDLKGKIRIPYTLDEMDNYSHDVTRKFLVFKQDVNRYRKSKQINHTFPLESLVRLLEAVERAQDYCENTLKQENNTQDYYV